MKIRVKERSFIARIAAFILRTNNVAIVFGRTIYLWNASKEDLLKNKNWLRHELVHVRQFLRYGFFPFIFMYLWESIKRGYYHNKFEVEARNFENLEFDNNDDEYEIGVDKTDQSVKQINIQKDYKNIVTIFCRIME